MRRPPRSESPSAHTQTRTTLAVLKVSRAGLQPCSLIPVWWRDGIDVTPACQTPRQQMHDALKELCAVTAPPGYISPPLWGGSQPPSSDQHVACLIPQAGRRILTGQISGHSSARWRAPSQNAASSQTFFLTSIWSPLITLSLLSQRQSWESESTKSSCAAVRGTSSRAPHQSPSSGSPIAVTCKEGETV